MSTVTKLSKLSEMSKKSKLSHQATMILQLDLAHPHQPPKKHVPSPVVRTAQYRRLQRRAAERKAAAEAVQEETVIDVEAEQAKADEIVVDVDAEQASIENVNARPEVNNAAEAKDATGDKAAEEAVEANTCELCDKTFETLKGLRAHIGSQHKAIPQVDGSNDVNVINEPTYCKVCKECPDEINTSEDINFHVMNDHEVKSVIENYGQAWASARKYCIRRRSPF